MAGLLVAGVDGEMDYAPVLTAGECVEIVTNGARWHCLDKPV